MRNMKSTSCTVHTFDCTISSTSCTSAARKKCKPEYGYSHQIEHRLWFHPWCISAADGVPDKRYKTMSKIYSELGHNRSRLSLLKIDIEGFEWEMLQDWQPSDPWLPEQVSGELHCTTAPRPDRYRMLSIGETTVFLQHFHRIGYRLAEQNLGMKLLKTIPSFAV